MPRKLSVSSEIEVKKRGGRLSRRQRLDRDVRLEVEERRAKMVKEQREMVREAARLGYLERIPVLSAIIDGEESSNRDKISAMSELAKVAGLYQMDITSDGKKIESVSVHVKYIEAPTYEEDEEPMDAEFLDVND